MNRKSVKSLGIIENYEEMQRFLRIKFSPGFFVHPDLASFNPGPVTVEKSVISGLENLGKTKLSKVKDSFFLELLAWGFWGFSVGVAKPLLLFPDKTEICIEISELTHEGKVASSSFVV